MTKLLSVQQTEKGQETDTLTHGIKYGVMLRNAVILKTERKCTESLPYI